MSLTFRRTHLLEGIAAASRRPYIISPSQSQTESVLSFNAFLRLIWWVAINSPLMRPTDSPRVRLWSLLSRMDRYDYISHIPITSLPLIVNKSYYDIDCIFIE